jgi:hypothetical protein
MSRPHLVREFYAAMRDERLGTLLALADPGIVCRPLVRRGPSSYLGHDGVVSFVRDMHAAHGNYRFEADVLAEEPGPVVRMLARIIPGPGHGPEPVSIRGTYTFRSGLIASVHCEPGPALS